MKEELGPFHVDIPGFFEAFFGDILHLKTASDAVFKKCKEGNNPLYEDIMPGVVTGLRGQERSIFFEWLVKLVDIIFDFVKEQVYYPKRHYEAWLHSLIGL